MMDPDAMKRIFQNLIINTLRYGSAPFTIVIRQEKDRVHCTFSNHADPAQIDVSRIFHRFYQGDRARQRGGSGLGMAIVSELCAQPEWINDKRDPLVPSGCRQDSRQFFLFLSVLFPAFAESDMLDHCDRTDRSAGRHGLPHS